MVDIGGEATNPWASAISIDEEWRRLEPILKIVLPKYGERISLDTRHPEIIKRALGYGPFILNDVTGFSDPAMVQIAAENRLHVIASHLPLVAKGDIQLAHTTIRMSSTEEVASELLKIRTNLLRAHIHASNIVLDPGIGFGKSMQCNWQLLKISKQLQLEGQTIMIGASRKRMLATDSETGQDIPGADKTEVARSLEAAKIAIEACRETNNPLWLRVHDVAAHVALLAD